MTMDSRKIVKDLNQRRFSTVLNDIQDLISKSKIDCSEICNILRAIYQAIVPSSVEMEAEDTKTTIVDMIPCINLCIDHVRSNFSCSDAVKNQFLPILYHIVRTFLKVELYHPALSCGHTLKSFLEDSEVSFNDKDSYTKNMCIMFWNDALRTEKNSSVIDFNLALALRTMSVEFLLLEKNTTLENFIEKVNIVLVRFCHNNHDIDMRKLEEFLLNIWSHLGRYDSGYEHKVNLYKILQTWIDILLKYLNDYSIFKFLLMRFQDIPKACKKKEQKALGACSALSKLSIQCFIFQEIDSKFKKICSNHQELCKNVEKWSEVDIKLLAYTCSITYSCFAKFFRPLKYSDDAAALSFLKSNISDCMLLVCHLINLVSEESVQKHTTLPCYVNFSSCHTVINTFTMLIKKEQNDVKREQLIKETEKFVKFSASKITVVTETDDMSKNIITFASCVTRLAMTLYSLNLYSESTYFFEVADSTFSMCRSFLEYNTEETQSTVWKLHEIFIYVCFLTGDHEKALEVITKSLIIHENKTKQCFDLWKKVKRDASRNGKDTVLSKTICDFIAKVNVELDAEKEMIYLVEEFRISKSERCNLDQAIIALSQKILSMPCSDSVRAYILLEILTMPSTVSNNVCDFLKKSLSEICVEVINLYVNLLANNPNDYTSKLYLSIAYFWLYHNGLKEMHDIAEKEAQNILKPPSPKPAAGVQNDVEEENDSCDIQPVHPLVSVSFEAETFKYLNLTFQLWGDISESQWEELSDIAKEKDVLDMIQATAEIFSSAVHDFKELKLWLLLRTVSVSTASKIHEFTAGISLIYLLVRLGYLNLAAYFVKEAEKCAESITNSESETAEIKFKLMMSYYHLHTAEFDDGLQILQDILSSPVLEKRFKSVKILHAEALILLSDYIQLPVKAFCNSDNVDYLIKNSSLAILIESVSICKALLKHFTEKHSSIGNAFDWICFKPLLIKNLLKAHIQLGELYFKCGDPRLSRCFLQEALKLAESQILTYWSSKILLVLGHIDFVCDNFKDCLVKTNGLKYIMDQSVKANYRNVLNCLQAKYSSPNSTDPLSPDSPDGLIFSSVPSIALPRQIKQTFIDKIDVMSSPLSKKHMKSNFDKLQFNFNEENFSMNLLQLETSLLSYLLSQSEADAKQSVDVLHGLLSYYNQLKNLKHVCSALTSLKLNISLEDPYARLQSKLEVLFYVAVQLQKLESFCLRNDVVSAKETVGKAFSFLQKASSCPNYSYPDVYALLKYHDIRVTLCEFYQIPLNTSLTHYFCQSVMPNLPKRKTCKENSALVNTPSTPVRRNLPHITITEHQSQTKKCRAPLKKNLLNSNLKKDLYKNSGQNSPFVVFSSSDEEENFESPLNSLSRASKTRSRHKLVSKKPAEKGESSVISYRIFTQKNSSLQVKGASDIWNLCLTDTPKLGKENKKTRALKTVPKSTQISKKKTRSATAAIPSSKSSQSKSKRTVNSTSIMSDSANVSKFDRTLKQSNSVGNVSPSRKMSIEYPRSSPHDPVSEVATFSKFSSDNKVNNGFSSDVLSSDNVFFSPNRNAQKTKAPYLIDDLCKDLFSLELASSKFQHVAAGNLDEVINELHELRLLIQNSMPYPLYGDICKLLGILLMVKRDGTWNNKKVLESSFLLSEAFSVSLRNVYFGNMAYYKESEFHREKEITKTLKMSNFHADDHIKSFLHMLPENWTVVQVTAIHNQEYLSPSDPLPCPTKLIISQFQNGPGAIIVSTDCSSDERFSSNFLTEFGKILEESYLTMMNNDSKSWWTTRSTLDLRMKELTRDMENIWLGCWKGLLLGFPQNEVRFKQVQAAAESISTSLPCINKRLLQILIDSAERLSKEQVCAAVCYLWSCNHDDNIHKKLCKSIRHISISLPDTERHPVILILDQSVQHLPWECMPILKNVPATRMPSLSILYTKLAMLESESVLNTGFDTSKTYYVLNPGGDLIHSQNYFQQRFENQESWNGITGRAPCVKDYVSGLKDHDFFIYCGHGSGRKYFEGTSIDKLRLQSTSILMGCSSGKLRRLGRVLEAHGLVLRLLLSGCPSITANLWDVTDKDIDRFTEKLLQSIVPDYDEIECQKYDVAKAVSFARGACKMRYLVGAAPVVYGFPVFARNKP